MTSPNLDLVWNKVAKTDPAFTKAITGRPYKGTSPNATYLVRKATEVFGPCGIGWGINVLNEGLLDGLDGMRLHRVHIRLWYVLDGKRGEVEHFGQTEFSGHRKDGRPFMDEDAPKKSLTDAMTKAMSLLGFAADIHLGQYDDNKYVAEVRREFAEASVADEARAYIASLKTEIENCTERAELDNLWKTEKARNFGRFNWTKEDPLYQELVAAFTKHGATLGPIVRAAE